MISAILKDRYEVQILIALGICDIIISGMPSCCHTQKLGKEYQLKKMYNLKFENYVLFGRQNWGFKAGTQHLSSEKLLLRGKEEPGYMGIFKTKTK